MCSAVIYILYIAKVLGHESHGVNIKFNMDLIWS